ncbi:MAG: TVP38/TMEM64 family protein [Cyanobacteria bacterium SID2]|nr:TVP38/TMEM64 family protein [Cyanobacteria bacterium SID2]MBP0005629.1 TVP38/TMEM64 family protein [Cyanobacteria bacterium SBC]
MECSIVRSLSRPLQGLSKALSKTIPLTSLFLISLATPVWAQEAIEPSGFNPQDLLRDALQQIQDLGALGVGAFILLYIVATVAFLPGSILTLGAGVVFGVVSGSVYVFFGATIGATLAFLVGRYIARDWVAKKIAGSVKFAAIDNAVGREGFKIVLLTRLSPIFPFNLLNYAYGITSVSLKDYVLASVGMIPGTIMYVYIGSLAGSLATIGTGEATSDPQAAIVQRVIQIVGFIATVAVVLFVTRIARNILTQEVGELTISDNSSEVNVRDEEIT